MYSLDRFEPRPPLPEPHRDDDARAFNAAFLEFVAVALRSLRGLSPADAVVALRAAAREIEGRKS